MLGSGWGHHLGIRVAAGRPLGLDRLVEVRLDPPPPPSPHLGHCPTSCSCIHSPGLMYEARGPRACSPSRFQEPGGLVCKGGSESGPEQRPDPVRQLALPGCCPQGSPSGRSHPRPLGTPWAAGSGWGVSWVGLGGQWGCEHQPPGCLFSHLQEGRAPTHPRMVLPLASSLLRAACWAAVSRGQCRRFCSTWGSAAAMLEASMSHTRTPRSSRSEALSLGWGPPCRIAGQLEPGPTAHHLAGRPTAPTRQARALCCRAALWSGRLASSFVSPWAARRMKARQSASSTCVRLRKGWGATGRADGEPSE